MSQREKILRWLEQRGDEGVHSFELYEARFPRAAAVICQLRKDGYAIESEPCPFRGEAKGCRYYLRSTELVPGVAQPVREPELVGARSGSSAYDPYSDWA
jgi:hypothetical protein